MTDPGPTSQARVCPLLYTLEVFTDACNASHEIQLQISPSPAHAHYVHQPHASHLLAQKMSAFQAAVTSAEEIGRVPLLSLMTIRLCCVQAASPAKTGARS